MKHIISMVVVLAVVTIKLRILAEVEVHAGVYFFAASVLASMVASLLMNRLGQHMPDAERTGDRVLCFVLGDDSVLVPVFGGVQ